MALPGYSKLHRYRKDINAYDSTINSVKQVSDLASERPSQVVYWSGRACEWVTISAMFSWMISIFVVVGTANSSDARDRAALQHGLMHWINTHWLVYIIVPLTLFAAVCALLELLDQTASVRKRKAILAAQKLMQWTTKPLYAVESTPLRQTITLVVRSNITDEVVEEEIIDEVNADQALDVQDELLQEYANRTNADVLSEFLQTGDIAPPSPTDGFEVVTINKQLTAARERHYQQTTPVLARAAESTLVSSNES